LLLGTGSEVGLCLAAQETLAAEGIAARVVSMPCWKLFEEQDTAYRNDILPPQVTARVGVEAGLRMGWDRYIGVDGRFVGMKGFGASAPADELFEHFGITAAHVEMAAKEAIENSQR
jgi:transketolase